MSENKSVTITLSSGDYYQRKPFLKVGELVKFTRMKGKKRIWAKVTQSTYNEAKLKSVYRPAPKSNLNKKSIFSKKKGEIIPMASLS